MKNIIVATDFSERSDRALRRATILAKQVNMKITLIHVVDNDQPRRLVDTNCKVAEELLNEYARTLKTVDNVNCDTKLILGAPFSGIIDATAQMNPELLVIGPHRRQIIRDLFLGTTAERVIRLAPCPVLMVNAPPSSSYQHAMMTTDLSDSSRHVIEQFSNLDFAKNLRKSILHVCLTLTPALTPSEVKEDYAKEECERAELNLAEFISDLKSIKTEPIVRNNQTTTVHEILTGANEIGADLIVTGTHAKLGLSKVFLGSVARDILRESDRDVLVVPPRTKNPKKVS